MLFQTDINKLLAVADTGFPTGGANLRGRCQPTYYLPIFFPKLHEKEKKWPRGKGCVPLDPPMISDPSDETEANST